ncbi:MAG: hypothetical protein LH614_04150 [Pyrinomonadaceae bacterium]|nr:hypothetical protein [Pyrinomonadaceae bacterium]
MDLINELSNELALTFLVEKKFTGKIESSDVPSLIDKVKHILQSVPPVETAKFPSVRGVVVKSIPHRTI